MEVIKAEEKDLPTILEIYNTAREFMIKTGNPQQWANGGPTMNQLLRDINQSNFYLIKENGEICGVFAFIIGEDPTYKIIEQGEWLSNSEYGTIHRVASNGKIHGILEFVIEYCSKVINHLRIDTHIDNKIMQHLIEKNGLKKCGIIYVSDGSPRIAYEIINYPLL